MNCVVSFVDVKLKKNRFPRISSVWSTDYPQLEKGVVSVYRVQNTSYAQRRGRIFLSDDDHLAIPLQGYLAHEKMATPLGPP